MEAKSIEPGRGDKIRAEGMIPAVIYGKKIKSRSLSLDSLIFQKTYRQAGESALIDLKIDKEEPVKILIQDVQLDPVTGDIIHVDFMAITMSERMKADIPLKFKGESLAVKDLKGVLVTNIDELEVECLPKDLVPEIEVDISALKTFDDVIRVKDVQIPKTLTVLDNAEEAVALVIPPREEKEELPAAQAEMPEVIGKGGEKEGEGEEKKESAGTAGKGGEEKKGS